MNSIARALPEPLGLEFHVGSSETGLVGGVSGPTAKPEALMAEKRLLRSSKLTYPQLKSGGLRPPRPFRGRFRPCGSLPNEPFRAQPPVRALHIHLRSPTLLKLHPRPTRHAALNDAMQSDSESLEVESSASALDGLGATPSVDVSELEARLRLQTGPLSVLPAGSPQVQRPSVEESIEKDRRIAKLEVQAREPSGVFRSPLGCVFTTC